MSAFHFFYPLEPRYGDIDAQRHVNNVAYFRWFEQARVRYLQHLGLWDGRDFDRIGVIVADAACSFKAPIRLDERIEIGVATRHIGNKSLHLVYLIREVTRGEVRAEGRTILVGYDFTSNRSIPVPDHWRAAIAAFEGWPAGGSAE
jgi:acyl-CoA thioester hydrolase